MTSAEGSGRRWTGRRHRSASEGGGYGVGPGKGSLGILQDPEFLLYYKTVQDQIKKAWTFYRRIERSDGDGEFCDRRLTAR